MGAVPVSDSPSGIAEIPDRSYPDCKLRGERLGDDRVQFLIAQLRQLIQRARAAVPAQVHVGIDEPREQRRPGKVGDRAVRGSGSRPRLDGEDGIAFDENQGAVGEDVLAVECARCPVSVNVDPRGSSVT